MFLLRRDLFLQYNSILFFRFSWQVLRPSRPVGSWGFSFLTLAWWRASTSRFKTSTRSSHISIQSKCTRLSEKQVVAAIKTQTFVFAFELCLERERRLCSSKATFDPRYVSLRFDASFCSSVSYAYTASLYLMWQTQVFISLDSKLAHGYHETRVELKK